MLTPRQRVEELIVKTRADRIEEIARKLASDNPFQIDDVTVYPGSYVMCYKGKPLRLTTAEFQMCSLMASHPNFTFTREQIADYIGLHEDTDDRAIDSYIKRIRRQFAVASRKTFNPIVTVYSVGYRWNGWDKRHAA